MERREQEEYKHVCKLCNKRFPSGKSLGGHMRSHVIANSKAATALKLKSKKAPIFETKLINGDHHDLVGAAGYELRENPKKSWRVEDDKLLMDNNNKQQRICKKCGKGFQSLKALCGHMSCHSNKERNFSRLNGYDDDDDDDDSWDSIEDDEEDEEEEEEEEELGSDVHQRSGKIESFSFGNGCSSNVSEIEHEQEEVAICLMMLSRDSGQKGSYNGVNFTTESSDNNSVILGGWSSSTFKAKKQNLSNLNGFVKIARKCAEMDNSDSGYFENGAKEVESDDSVDGYAYGFKKHGYGYVDYGSEERNPGRLKRPFRIKTKSSVEFDEYDEAGNSSSKKMKQENLSSYKAGKYECSICQRTFKTHQVLGGHIITHRRNNNNNGGHKGSSSTRQENDDHLSVETSNFGSESMTKFEIKKPKVHKCPFCPKVFKSGQALGGHKRSHLIGCSSEDRALLVQSAERNSARNRHPLLDLNLPAPSDEEAGNNGGHF